MASRFVSPEALASTYDHKKGWETVQQYREATRLRNDHPDMARAEIARRVERSPSTVRGWVAEGKTPPPVQAVETAQDRGWIDIESTSETFRVLNQLVAWVFSGGGLRQDRFVPSFSVDDQLALAALHRLLTWVDVSYRVRDYDDTDRALEVIPDDAASLLGRVLHVLGAPVGVKATHDDLSFPTYLDTVEESHRRGFARVYVLNRGNINADGRAGTHIQGPQSTAFCQALRDLFATVTDGSATLTSQHRLWVSADAVHDLADGPPLRPGLATQAAFGTLSPPTDRAFATTYRRGDRPGGYCYAQLYQHVRESDDSPATLVTKHPDLTTSTIRNWRRGHTPRVHRALADARAYGWITPPADGERALALTGLLAWIFAKGTLRARSYHPVFRLSADDQRVVFDSLADVLELTYSFAKEDDPTRTTEIHPSEDGVLLGRVLYALGAPLGRKTETNCLPPVYLFRHQAHAKQFFAVWCQHHATADEKLRIRVPDQLGDQFADSLLSLLSVQFSTESRPTNDGIVVPSPSAELDFLVGSKEYTSV